MPSPHGIEMPAMPEDPIDANLIPDPSLTVGNVKSQPTPSSISSLDNPSDKIQVSEKIYPGSLKYKRLIGKAGPVKPRKPKPSKSRDTSPERVLSKCHLCQKLCDITEVGCSYYDELRLKERLYFCSVKCMNCYRDFDLPIDAN